MAELRDRLIGAGIREPELDAKVRMFERVIAAHGARASEARCWWVPGRLEFLGKHTDYAGGRSLLCAVEHGFAVAVVPRPDGKLEVLDVARKEHALVDITPDLAAPQGHWLDYPFTVGRRVLLNFGGVTRLTGASIAFESDLPSAAGMSSSSALIIATFIALSEVNDLPARPEYRAAIGDRLELAAYLGCVENGRSFRSLPGDRGVGTSGGSEDHVAILCSRPDVLGQFHFAPLRQEDELMLPADHAFVVADSGIVAPKTGAAMTRYNRVAERAAAALGVWRAATGSRAATLGAALEESSDAPHELIAVLERSAHPHFTSQSLIERVRQFSEESNQIIPAAAAALRECQWELLRSLVRMSQRGAERRLENQTPETTALAHSASESGALAASAFGAGFGGSVYAFTKNRGHDFAPHWESRYRRLLPDRSAEPRFFTTRAGPGASQV